MKTILRPFTLSVLFVAIVCGCSGGSGVKSNQYLGSLPALYADFQLEKTKLESQIPNKEEVAKMDQEKFATEYIKFSKKAGAIQQKYAEKISEESLKIKEKEVPMTFSALLKDSPELFYTVSNVKLAARDWSENWSLGERITLQMPVIKVEFSAKDDINIRATGWGSSVEYNAYYRLIKSDGSTIKAAYARVTSSRMADDVNYSKGAKMVDDYILIRVDEEPAQYADFAGIEFITQEEYRLY